MDYREPDGGMGGGTDMPNPSTMTGSQPTSLRSFLFLILF